MRKEGMTKQALSSMAYFFLRMAFAKENYPESVLEELQWVVDDLLSEDPDDGLLERYGKNSWKAIICIPLIVSRRRHFRIRHFRKC